MLRDVDAMDYVDVIRVEEKLKEGRDKGELGRSGGSQ
jgi:hypothetical protein